MAINKKTIRLLLLEQSQNEAERIVSLFRNAGHATRVHRVCQVTELEQALTQSWDLFIAAPSCDELSPEDALMVLQKTARDTSFIMLVDNNDSDSITEALELGANDAVPM
ncbi:MAG: ferrous iron transporter C, partial [Gammaproteobacteria bacterium]|nr:ferrous iron transporter C [Gammaproteobacteria bacterium]